ncbi:MAG TPA: fasciclin domain-containing protein [Longimicrobiales bacterium]|nr:fasciclin domain-containing protein [Longimicrobiales bacterium]
MRHPNRSLRGPTLASAFFLASLLVSCSPADGPPDTAGEAVREGSNRGQAYVRDEKSAPNILAVAMGSPDHTTLVAAVQAAELENVLVNAGPLTVFAPTNAAFESLPAGTVEDLLRPENKQKLARIVTSHAAPGSFTLERLKDGDKLYQATGHYVDVEVRDGATYVNGARILGTVVATNGVVHVVDKVFLIAAQ